MEKYMFNYPFLLPALEKVLSNNNLIGKDYILSSYVLLNEHGTDTAVLVYSAGTQALDYFKIFKVENEVYVSKTIIDRNLIKRAIEVAHNDDVARLTHEKAFKNKLFNNALRAKNDLIFGSNKQNHQMLREYYDISEMYPEDDWTDFCPDATENLEFNITKHLEVVR